MDNNLLLLDANSYFYRAFYAMPYLTSPAGEPTGAIYGTINMLLSLLKAHPSKRLVVVFDGPGPKFRHELLASYKSHRPPMPQEMKAQLEITKKIIRAMGILVLEEPNLEADDVLASLVALAKKHHLKVIISTGDKDLTQLVDDEVLIVDTMQRRTFDAKEVEAKFGVSPSKMTEYLMLLGDQSDEIPGVSGIGKVTAAKLLNTYGDLAHILENLAKLPAKTAKALEEAKTSGQLDLTRKLVSLKVVPLNLTLEDMIIKAQDSAKLKEFYQNLGFHQWLKALGTDLGSHVASIGAKEVAKEAPKEAPKVQGGLKALSSGAGLAAFLDQAKDLGRLAILTKDNFKTCHFIAKEVFKLENVLDQALWQQLSELKEVETVVSDSKAWWKFWLSNHLSVPKKVLDVQLMAYLIDNARRHYSLDSLLSDYGLETEDDLLRLSQALEKDLSANLANLKLLNNIDQPLSKILAKMELAGVSLDAKELTDFSAELAFKIDKLAKEIYKLTGREFNLNSPKQLSEVLYQQLNLPTFKKTATGLHSTSEAALERLAPSQPLVAKILAYRGLTKLKGTYLDPLPKLIDPVDKRVHTHYHQSLVLTGRLSSSEPNLQNIPMWSDEGQRIRRAFKAPSGKVLLTLDYSQIELRLMAHLASDASLIKAFKDGDDVHKLTASEVLAKPVNAITDLDRRLAKTINFGLIYGMSPFGLAERLHIPSAKAINYVKRYFERFSAVKSYISAVHEEAKTKGSVRTILGRRLMIPNLHAAKVSLKQAAYRVAVNATVQGSAAELIKLAMIKVDEWIQESKKDIKMLMQVHDELIFEVAESEVKECSQEIQRIMESAYPLKVPLEAKAGWGKTLEEAKH